MSEKTYGGPDGAGAPAAGRRAGEGGVSSLGYALLGLLARESLSGYDLARRMRDRIGYFWHARHSQIYPELARLERAGLVRHEVVQQRDRPHKKVYAATAAGEATLRDWVTSPLEPPGVRDELVLRAYSLWLADPDAAAALFRDQERIHLAQLARYEQIEGQMRGAAHGAAPARPPPLRLLRHPAPGDQLRAGVRRLVRLGGRAAGAACRSRRARSQPRVAATSRQASAARRRASR